MAIDFKLLNRAKLRLEDNKRAFSVTRERRLREVYGKCPRVMEIDRELRGTVIDVIGLALKSGQDPADRIAELRDQNLGLQSERAQTLISAGFPPDYIDDEYMCPACRDTGYAGTQLCACLKKLYDEELRDSLSSLFKLGHETFDNFDFSWYDDTPDPDTGLSPRRNIEYIYEMSVRYATRFGRDSYNLFFNGPTGLGKTFLSACIARVVADKGFSVAYDMAFSIFAAFEEEKFSKTADTSAARDEIRRYLECDLLIVDDLGTEMTTSFTVSALYELLNTRLVTGKKTIVSSNLTPDELHRRYTPQIMSRLEGEFQILKFYGADIRLLKKGL